MYSSYSFSLCFDAPTQATITTENTKAKPTRTSSHPAQTEWEDLQSAPNESQSGHTIITLAILEAAIIKKSITKIKYFFSITLNRFGVALSFRHLVL